MRRRTLVLGPIEADMTSMIDVTFLLLVFFLVSLKVKALEGKLDTELPRDLGERASRVEDLLTPLDLRLVLDPTRPQGVAVRVDGRRVLDVAAVAPLLREALARQPDLRARLGTGPGVTHGMVVAVVDACVEAGLLQIGFAADRDD